MEKGKRWGRIEENLDGTDFEYEICFQVFEKLRETYNM